MAVSLHSIANPTEADSKPVWDGLRQYNIDASRLPMNREDVCIQARAEDGTVVGGLVGYRQWDWLYVDLLWIDDSQRGTGLGASLMAQAEAEAAAAGCQWARLYTYDFQAPGFYEKIGYERWCVMDGYPPGHSQIWYRKRLTAA